MLRWTGKKQKKTFSDTSIKACFYNWQMGGFQGKNLYFTEFEKKFIGVLHLRTNEWTKIIEDGLDKPRGNKTFL